MRLDCSRGRGREGRREERREGGREGGREREVLVTEEVREMYMLVTEKWRERGREDEEERLTQANVVSMVVCSDGLLCVLTVHCIEKPQLRPHLLSHHLPILCNPQRDTVYTVCVCVCACVRASCVCVCVRVRVRASCARVNVHVCVCGH